jgi:hypothetical protein
MESFSATHAADFPQHLDDVLTSRSAVESFTWGPQTLALLAGLFWLFDYEVRDVPEIARNTAWIAAGVTLAALLGAFFAARRNRRRIALYPHQGRLALYRGGVFQYSFAPEAIVLVRKDFYLWGMLVLKLFVPTLILIALLVFVIYYAIVKTHNVTGFLDALVLTYLLGFAIFLLVAMIRSNVTLRFCWLPDEKGKPNQPAHFPAKELLKLEEQ